MVDGRRSVPSGINHQPFTIHHPLSAAIDAGTGAALSEQARMSSLFPARLRTSRQRTGTAGEEAAAAELQAAGYEILRRNYRCADGEVDLIAREGDVIVFVEVKTRSSYTYGLP